MHSHLLSSSKLAAARRFSTSCKWEPDCYLLQGFPFAYETCSAWTPTAQETLQCLGCVVQKLQHVNKVAAINNLQTTCAVQTNIYTPFLFTWSVHRGTVEALACRSVPTTAFEPSRLLGTVASQLGTAEPFQTLTAPVSGGVLEARCWSRLLRSASSAPDTAVLESKKRARCSSLCKHARNCWKLMCQCWSHMSDDTVAAAATLPSRGAS